jgi:hypothetical protein
MLKYGWPVLSKTRAPTELTKSGVVVEEGRQFFYK